MASFSERKRIPACLPGRNPFPQYLDTKGWPLPPLVTRVTKLGRLSFMDPNPYDSQEPMVGLPGNIEPVCIKVTPGPWLIASVCIELITQRSSATLRV